jgi:hypothetical protein
MASAGTPWRMKLYWSLRINALRLRVGLHLHAL